MKLKSIIFKIAVFNLFVFVTHSFAAINIAISPNLADPTTYLLEVSGTGDLAVTPVEASHSTLYLDGVAFMASTGFPVGPELTYGFVDVVFSSPTFADEYSFGLITDLPLGVAHSFAGDNALVYLGSDTYENTFIAGTYNITSSDGIFGSNSTGTLTISAVPEPSTYALFSGILMLAFVSYRRSKK